MLANPAPAMRNVSRPERAYQTVRLNECLGVWAGVLDACPSVQVVVTFVLDCVAKND